jgi:hypothetical protein
MVRRFDREFEPIMLSNMRELGAARGNARL